MWLETPPTLNKTMKNFMTDNEAKKPAVKMGLYLVSPEQTPGIKWPFRPKDALPDEG